MLRRQSDLLVGLMLNLVLIGLVVSDFLPPILQGILAIPFVLFVPGYALTNAIFPGLSLRQLERLLIAIGLSLGVIILSGLVLNITPWGLQTSSWLWILSVVTLVASGVAMWRRSQVPAKESTRERFQLPLRQAFLYSLAVMVIGFALKLTLTPQAPSNIQGYTSLWISPELEAQADTVLVGIHSQEFSTTHYSLQLSYNGQLNLVWPDISLAPGVQWQQSISLPAGQGLAEVVLYRADDPGVIYRQVSIAFNK